jgi:hypothetical protein
MLSSCFISNFWPFNLNNEGVCMKKTIKLTICLCLGIFGFFTPSYALSGNYQETCTKCQLAQGTLQCECQKANGARIYSSLSNARYCTNIQNIDGQLTCNGNALPAGSYQQTCQTCKSDGFRLACQCQNRDQALSVFTVLNNIAACKPGSIQNINGQLKCDHRYVNTLPAGSYKQTCARCNFDGYKLACQCRKNDQSWDYTILRGANQCYSIQNRDGQLTCN